MPLAADTNCAKRICDTDLEASNARFQCICIGGDVPQLKRLLLLSADGDQPDVSCLRLALMVCVLFGHCQCVRMMIALAHPVKCPLSAKEVSALIVHAIHWQFVQTARRLMKWALGYYEWHAVVSDEVAYVLLKRATNVKIVKRAVALLEKHMRAPEFTRGHRELCALRTTLALIH